MRSVEYQSIAVAFGCSVGQAEWIPAAESGPTVNRAVLKAIDMGKYQSLQRGLLTKSWGRKSDKTRYNEMIKILRSDKSKP